MKWDAEDKYFPFRTSWKKLITWYHENNGKRLSAMNDKLKLETNTVLLEQLASTKNMQRNIFRSWNPEKRELQGKSREVFALLLTFVNNSNWFAQ